MADPRLRACRIKRRAKAQSTASGSRMAGHRLVHRSTVGFELGSSDQTERVARGGDPWLSPRQWANSPTRRRYGSGSAEGTGRAGPSPSTGPPGRRADARLPDAKAEQRACRKSAWKAHSQSGRQFADKAW